MSKRAAPAAERKNGAQVAGGENPKALIRYAVFCAAFAGAALFLVWRVSEALLLLFAGIVFAAFLDALTFLLGKLVQWPRSVRLMNVCTVILVVVSACIAWGGTAIGAQGSELAATVREQINNGLAWLKQHGLKFPADSAGDLTQMRDATPTLKSMLPDVGGLFGPAWTAIATLVAGLGDGMIIAFLGLFLAAQPLVYRDAILLLAPPDRQDCWGLVLEESGQALRHWILGQLVTMALIGLLVWLGLMLIGVGPAALLGLQAGLLAFVPTLGPLLAGIIIIVASLPFGIWAVIGAAAIYVSVQTLESYVLTPMVQRRAVSVPPAMLFSGQIVLGVLFGVYGLALATPLAAIIRVFFLRLHVERTPASKDVSALAEPGKPGRAS
ncbi:AI-2E family transporter [Mesorhizobium sp. BR-1-1-10]|uniref:AI-2E family transporter n=1 Tax=Mesorhizobium sp. BR-1-1-10 TaxID=2876660 RepID=UPI001CD16425|nr:AI-2E family transporter [Mesorhizobium sp. BR-1-1-10]MBZ9974265.1 AI-2E family transporter [Mesorhizobium sp. BR-1-1-10]